jgi:D-amino-acid dehydrogenase
MPDVLILGAGVAGLCTAWDLCNRGYRVTVLDREGPERQSASHGNAGMIVPSHFVPLAAPGMVALGLKWMWNPESPFWVRPRLDADLVRWALLFSQAARPERVTAAAPLLRDLSLASKVCFEDLAARHGNVFALQKRGLLMLCKTGHGLEEEAKTAEQAHRLGLPAQVLSAAETAALDPGLRMEIAGSVYFPEDAFLVPGLFMGALERWLTDAGVQILWNTEVHGFQRKGRRIVSVETSRGGLKGLTDLNGLGDLTASEVVLCAGFWSDALARSLGLSLPLQAGKGYSLTVSGLPRRPGIAAILTEARVAVSPMGDTVRFGGTLELGGRPGTIEPARVRGIVRSALSYYPDLDPKAFDGVPAWSGLRPCSPDGLPYLGRPARFDNLVVATGHAMLGMSLGPITGRLAGQVIAGETPDLPLNLLSPDRYAAA